jgi:vacuolar-type H+-ATPase subunit I/STV1
MALFLSDLFIGFYADMAVVYGAFALTVCLGFTLRRQRSALRIVGASVAGALLFFILTNLGVWAFGALYPKTPGGLVDCYFKAIPFFGNTLLSSLLYSAILFGGLALAESRFTGLREYRPLPGAA